MRARLSVALLTAGGDAEIRKTVSCLRAQTIVGELELLIGAPRADDVRLCGDAVAAFAACRLLSVGDLQRTGDARAALFRAATGPVVVTAEDHCYPDRDWAESLVAAHVGPWTGVGPLVLNANPLTATSWADLLLGFGSFLARPTAVDSGSAPWHNTAYKREAVMACDAELPRLLGVEGLLQKELLRRGQRLRLEPRARVYHLNMSRWASFLAVQHHGARSYAAERARGWNALRRLTYVSAWPLIAGLRFGKGLRDARRVRAKRALPRAVPVVLGVGALVAGFGEALGYAFGAGRSAECKGRLEFGREALLWPGDRKALVGPAGAR